MIANTANISPLRPNQKWLLFKRVHLRNRECLLKLIQHFMVPVHEHSNTSLFFFVGGGGAFMRYFRVHVQGLGYTAYRQPQQFHLVSGSNRIHLVE